MKMYRVSSLYLIKCSREGPFKATKVLLPIKKSKIIRLTQKPPLSKHNWVIYKPPIKNHTEVAQKRDDTNDQSE